MLKPGTLLTYAEYEVYLKTTFPFTVQTTASEIKMNWAREQFGPPATSLKCCPDYRLRYRVNRKQIWDCAAHHFHFKNLTDAMHFKLRWYNV